MHSKISEMFQLQCALRVLLTQGLEEDGEAENRRWGRFFPISGTVCGFMIFYTSNGVIWKYKQTWHSSSSARRSVRTSSGPKSSKISPPGCKNCFRGFILLLCLCFPTKKTFCFTCLFSSSPPWLCLYLSSARGCDFYGTSFPARIKWCEAYVM